MLIGTGIDLIEIERIAQSIDRFGERFLHRIFTDREIAYCRGRQSDVESFAARFAAKEATAKALGTGMELGVTWKDIEVVRLAGERPTLELHGHARRRARDLEVRSVSLSLTHTGKLAMAMVVIES